MKTFIEPPKFEDILDGICYSRADDEPLIQLRRIYPFSKITKENQYDYENIVLFLSPLGLRYMLPYILDFLWKEDFDFSSNLSMAFEFLVTPDYSESEKFMFVKDLGVEEREFILGSIIRLKKRCVSLGLKAQELAPLLRWEKIINEGFIPN